MKQLILIPLLAILLSSCGHQVSTVGIGTGFSIGGGEYGSIRYGDGLFGNFITKDGVDFKAELDSTTGFSYDPTSHTYKGIKSISYSVSPQISGYAVQMGKDNPQAAKQYYNALTEYYKAKYAQPAKQDISDTKSTTATTSISSAVKKAVGKVVEKVAKNDAEETAETEDKDAPEQEQEAKICNVFDNLDDNCAISYQKQLAEMFLSYADDTTKNKDGVKLKDQLTEFLKVINGFAEVGRTETNLRLSKAKVCGKVLTELTVVHYDSWHDIREIPCVGCELFED